MRTTLIGVFVLALAACGGSKTGGSEEPNGGGGGAGDDDDDGGDDMVTQEQMDEINTYFQRKQAGRSISDCWVKAMEADEVPDNSKGQITLNMTIGTDGKVSAVKTATLEPRSAKTFESCVHDKVRGWSIVQVEQPFDTSWTFKAGEL